MGINTTDVHALYFAAVASGHVLPGFPLAPLADYADRFFQDDIIDGWQQNKAALFQSAGSEFDMMLTDGAGRIQDDAIRNYYQLVHANPALVLSPQRAAFNNLMEWRTARLIFPVYGAHDMLHTVTVPLLAIEDMLAENRRDATWALARNPAQQSVMSDEEKQIKNKNTPPLRHMDTERATTAHEACSVYENVTQRAVPVRPPSALLYSSDMELALDMAAIGRNGGDGTRPLHATGETGGSECTHDILMRGRFSLQ